MTLEEALIKSNNWDYISMNSHTVLNTYCNDKKCKCMYEMKCGGVGE